MALATQGDAELPQQLIRHVSLWELEQRLREHGLDPSAAYDDRALQGAWQAHTHEWMHSAARALALCIVSGTAFLDVPAVVLDGAAAPALLQGLVDQTKQALSAYNWEGLSVPPQLELGTIGSNARALGGALLPLHTCFAPDHDLFLKA
jgi:predicted NBD/HSP70 family sugar kinase